MRRLISIGVALALGTTALLAHEFWLSPASWRVRPGERATLLVNVGERFPDATSFTAPERIEAIRLIGPSGEINVPPPFRREKESLAAGVDIPAAPGTYVGVVLVKPRFIEIEAADFEEYLRHEGLLEVSAERKRRAESGKPGRERYTRYGKTLLRAGDSGRGAHATRPVGLQIELVPLTDPTRLTPGESCRFRLLFGGKPVPGASVGAIDAGADAKPDTWPIQVRTDARGEVEIPLKTAGPWLVRSVHMVRRSGEGGPEAADWESYWASLSFALDAGT